MPIYIYIYIYRHTHRHTEQKTPSYKQTTNMHMQIYKFMGNVRKQYINNSYIMRSLYW